MTDSNDNYKSGWKKFWQAARSEPILNYYPLAAISRNDGARAIQRGARPMATGSPRSLSILAAISNEELQRAWQDVCAGMDRMEFLANASEPDVRRYFHFRRQFEKQLLDGNGPVAQPDATAATEVRVDKDGDIQPRAAGHVENGSQDMEQGC